jgi:hypothetical protein
MATIRYSAISTISTQSKTVDMVATSMNGGVGFDAAGDATLRSRASGNGTSRRRQQHHDQAQQRA